VLTSSPTSARLGAQSPRLHSVPHAASSAGQEAVELAASAGLHLYPWQQHVLEHALGERDDGQWAAFEVALIVSRQNGKGSILEARELAGMFLFGEQLILHSAHEFRTAVEAFHRILMLIEQTPDLDSRVSRVLRSHGDEGIELKNGSRLKFVARTGGSARGLSADLVILDEAFNLPDATMASMLPTLSARPNPQVWYTSSAVNAEEHRNGWVLTRLRDRGIAGGDPGLAYFEWSADEDAYKADPESTASNWTQIALANPSLGFRPGVSEERVERERASLTPKGFAVERLGVGDWPRTAEGVTVFPASAWEGCASTDAVLGDPFVLAADAPPDRSEAYIVASDGTHVEVVETKRGLGWVADYLIARHERHGCQVVIDGKGAIGSLIPKLEAAGVKVLLMNAADVARACGQFYDAVTEGRLTHLDDPILNVAVAGATQRPLGDAWAWDRKHATVPLSPLIAATNALWGANQAAPDYDPLASAY
jgi:hypothetical protein